MSSPKPPFHTTTEELLYSILQKLPDVTYLTANDINSIAKLNALIMDGDIPTDESITSALDAIKGKVPEEGNTLGKLYSIIQGLGNLKSEDIDTLAEINAILTDADLATIADLEETVVGINGGAPEAGNTLAKLYNLLAGKKDKYVDTYVNTYFVSPNVAGGAGVKGDYMLPFTPDEAYQLAGNGDTIAFLPGIYYMVGNMAKNGVAYTTFGGRALLVMGGFNLFDYEALDDADSAITINGDFEFSNSGGVVFNFKQGTIPRKYIIRWSEAVHYGGTILRMPTVLSTGIFEGNIDISQDCLTPAIECSAATMTSGAGIMNLTIINNSQVTFAIKPWFSGFKFNISYIGKKYGLFSQPINAGSDNNVYVLNIKQDAPCVTYLTSGECSGSIQGGQINLFSGSINLNARMTGCLLYASPQTSCKVIAQASSVTIVNDQVKVLQLDGVWEDCSYSRTSTSLCILEGQFYNLQINTSVGILKITGYVRLTDTTSAVVTANDYLEVSGKLVANALQVIQLAQRAPVVISGYIKQLGQFAPAIKSANGGYTHSLEFKNAVIESGSSSPDGIKIDTPDGLELKLYGKSYSNKPIGGSASVIYVVGSTDDLVIDTEVSVLNI
ncbi:MAG TPA: hypothetical protein VIM75_00430 [Ohtaekwangia sp.]|uniref:hypothetical protein n=1 Tax=Ohtaekwangia sp. TaxID=2066019 RepID=UPI002F946BB6